MTVFEFLRTARKCDIVDLLYTITSKCDCYGECPLNRIAHFNVTQSVYDCDKCKLLKWLDSEIKPGWGKYDSD